MIAGGYWKEIEHTFVWHLKLIMTSSIIIIIRSLLYVHQCKRYWCISIIIYTQKHFNHRKGFIIDASTLAMVDSANQFVWSKLLTQKVLAPLRSLFCRSFSNMDRIARTNVYDILSSHSLSLWFYWSMDEIISKLWFHHFQRSRQLWSLTVTFVTGRF